MSDQQPIKKRRRRPISLWLLILGFLLLSIYGWLRLQQSMLLWEILVMIEVWPGPLYLAISGAIWGFIGLASAASLFIRRWWAVRVARGAVVFLAVWYWVDRLALVRSDAAQANTVFMALLTMLVITYTFAVTRRIGQTFER